MAEKKKLFKRKLCGYRAEEVYAYIKELNEKLEQVLKAKDAEVARLNSEIAELTNSLGGPQAVTSSASATPQSSPIQGPINVNSLVRNACHHKKTFSEAIQLIEPFTNS